MAEWSKALRSGRSRVLPAWVRIPLLSIDFLKHFERTRPIEDYKIEYDVTDSLLRQKAKISDEFKNHNVSLVKLG